MNPGSVAPEPTLSNTTPSTPSKPRLVLEAYELATRRDHSQPSLLPPGEEEPGVILHRVCEMQTVHCSQVLTAFRLGRGSPQALPKEQAEKLWIPPDPGMMNAGCFLGCPSCRFRHHPQLSKSNSKGITQVVQLLNWMAWSGNHFRINGRLIDYMFSKQSSLYIFSLNQTDNNEKVLILTSGRREAPLCTQFKVDPAGSWHPLMNTEGPGRNLALTSQR